MKNNKEIKLQTFFYINLPSRTNWPGSHTFSWQLIQLDLPKYSKGYFIFFYFAYYCFSILHTITYSRICINECHWIIVIAHKVYNY